MSALDREHAKNKTRAPRGDGSRVSSDSEDDHWRAARWQAARKAMADGTFKTQPSNRFPVILTPDGPVSSAEQLQRLAEMESLPRTTEASLIGPDGETEIEKVTICDVSLEETEKVEKKAEVLTGITDDIYVLFQGKRRYAMVVKRLKEGIALVP